MPYKELRADYSLTKTTLGINGQRSYYKVDAGASTCEIESLPAIGSAFSDLYPTCRLRSIQEVPYAYKHVKGGTGEEQWKYILQYSTTPDTDWVNDNFFADTYTGGTTAVSLDLSEKGSNWNWMKQLQTPRADYINKAILKRQVFRVEAKGTYSKTVAVPNVENDTFNSWTKFFTGGGDTTYGILNSLGKLNYAECAISSGTTNYETDAITPWPAAVSGSSFKIGQLLFTSFDCKAGISESGLHIWIVTMNFAYRSINLSTAAADVNVAYPWLYLLNDQANAGDKDYQIPVHNLTSLGDGSPEDYGATNYLYDFIDFNTSLKPTK